MPIHIIRDVALTIRSFYKRIHDFVRYRQATKDMNDRYPDATSEEVAREDVCIICREDMRAWQQGVQDANAPPPPPPTALDERTRPKKLPCGHILHFACLRSWLERQQNCPTCRRPVLVSSTAGPATTVNAAAQNVGAGPQHNQQQPPNAGHIAGQQPPIAHNVFNFGPFRLAFGARLGGQGLPPQMNNNHPAAPNQQGQPANPQGIGNGFGLFRPPQQRTTATFTPLNVPAQLHQIELQIMREVNALRVQADQLYLVRSLQGELARLRIQQAQANHMAANIGHAAIQQRPPNSLPQGIQLQNVPQVFTANQQQQTLGSGHPDLPPGMTLPEGWTVLPLQRIGQSNPAVPHTTSNTQAPFLPNPTTGPALSQGSTSDTGLSTDPNLPSPATPAAQDSGHPGNSTAAEPVLNGYNTPLPHSLTAEVDNTTHPEPSITTTSGQPSQAPSSPLIPNWGSAPASQPDYTASADPETVRSTHGPMNGNTKISSRADDDEASTAERREAKGKGRAVTIEDSIEDVE